MYNWSFFIFLKTNNIKKRIMEINVFLNSIKSDFIESCNLFHPNQIGNTITIYRESEDLPELDEFQLAIIGVEEDRNSFDNKGCKEAPNVIRKSLYQLFNHWNNLNIIDLGNIKNGYEIEDTYFALNNVIITLMKYHIVPIILGGSQDLTYPIYQVYENTGKLVNITSIDSKFDIGHDNETLNSNSYLSHIILHQPNFLFNYTNIGYQNYYVDKQSIDIMKQLLFDVHRIGNIKNNIEITEPLLRNADIITIDTSAFCAADAPGIKYNSPNGFSSEDGCKMTRYAGLNPKLTSIGFFEYNPSYDINNITANTLSQMIWYFIEGFSLRINDFPAFENKDFKRYIVKMDDINDDIIFLCHKISGKWWLDLSFKSKNNVKYERHHYIPCSIKDYELAMENELPDIWWQFYQKLM